MLYQRALSNRLRSLQPVDLAASRAAVTLTSVYIERPLAPLSPSAEPTALPASAPTLAALAAEPSARVLLAAEPGYGATTALRRLALACAAAGSGQIDPAAETIEAWGGPIPLPLLLRSPHTSPEDQLAADGLAQHLQEIQRALAAGECLVLVDDVAGEEGAAALARLAALHPACRLVAAARPGTPPPRGFAAYALPPLERQQIADLAARWCAALAPARPDLAAYTASFQGRLLPDDRLLALAAWPPAVEVCAALEAEGGLLPRDRAEVYDRLIDRRLAGHDAAPLADALGVSGLDTADRRLALLEPLALALQSLSPSPDAAPSLPRAQAEELLLAALAPYGAQSSVATALADRCLRAGLLAAAEGDALRIPHCALREQLAARALAHAPDFQARALALQAEPRWWPTLRLAARARERASTGEGLAAIGELLQLRRPAQTLLAAACLADIPGAARAPALADTARGRLLDLLGDLGATLDQRIRAGLLLGEIGDPRFDEPLPPLAYIEAGGFTLGASIAGFEDEGPPHRVDLAAYKIGVFPVTNREYARFLAAKPGYPAPHYWHDPRFNNPSLPAVGVTWHDAHEYCAWLTAELARAGRLQAGAVVRLPLEAEWEKAATWGPSARRKRAFPWGAEWDHERANTADGRGAWLTTPPGCYPHGASLYGVHDMTGNVWEWTASEYASYPGALLPQRQRGHYVLRGSSCVSLAINARATYRGSHLPPHYWRYHLGFRIVVGRPLPQRDEGGA